MNQLMKNIEYKGRIYRCRPEETVMDALLRQGATIPFSCRNGTCHTCLMKSTSDLIPEEAQQGLNNHLKINNYFLPCKCYPRSDIEIIPARKDDIFNTAKIIKNELAAENIHRLWIELDEPLRYRPGQYINIRHPEGQIRSYSIACMPTDGNRIELHIKKMRNGCVSNWLCDAVSNGDSVEYQGPFGECYYQSDNPVQDLIMVGTGTGIAPLYGIIRDALSHGHKGQLFLYHGTREVDGLYLHDELRKLEKEHSNFHYRACLSGDDIEGSFLYGRALSIAFEVHKELGDCGVYLCGNPDMVKEGIKLALQANALSENIHCESFLLQDKRLNNTKYFKYGLRKGENYHTEDSMEFKEEERRCPEPDMELWDALNNDGLLIKILTDFYTRVYNDEKLYPFFRNVTKQRIIGKQYSFMKKIFTGQDVYFGERPRNAHHWMVISDELFDYRVGILDQVLTGHNVDEKHIDKIHAVEESFRKMIVKSHPWKKIVNGIHYPLEGNNQLVLTVGSLCDGCQCEIPQGEKVTYHVRLGTIYCLKCTANGNNG